MQSGHSTQICILNIQLFRTWTSLPFIYRYHLHHIININVINIVIIVNAVFDRMLCNRPSFIAAGVAIDNIVLQRVNWRK